MGVDLNGIVHLVMVGLTENVFGHMLITTVILSLFIIMFCLLINIPLPFAIAIPLPFIVVLTAYGYLTILIGGLLSALFLIIAVVSFTEGIGNK